MGTKYMNNSSYNKKTLSCFFFFVFALFFLILPQSAHALSPMVKKIEITGNQRVPTETISATIKTRTGFLLNSTIVREDMKALYALGQFLDIRIESTQVAGGVKVIYSFTEKPLISEVDFEGNRKIKDDKLEEDVNITLYQPLNSKELATAIDNIKKAYIKKGYYLVEVSYYIGNNESGEAKLVFSIRENLKAFVRRVMFLGNHVFSDDKLRDQIKTKKKGFFSFLTKSGSFDEDKIKVDVGMLTYFYLNSGYYRARVSPPRTYISKDKRYIFLTFDIHEGKKYNFGKINIEGDVLTTKDQLKSLLKSKEGDVYNRMNIDIDLQDLGELYGDQGYAFANIIPHQTPDDEKLTVDVTYVIEKGDRITIEKINIKGNTTTRDKVIRRELKVYEDDRYSLKGLRKSREKLNALGYFSDINFATPRGTSDDTVNLDVTVTERPTGSFNISAAFSSVESFIFSASVSKQNFFGFGISGSISGEISKKRQNFFLSLQDNYFLDSEWILGGSAYRTAYHYPDYKREAYGGSVTFGHKIFEYWTALLGYTAEHVKVSDLSPFIPQRLKQKEKGFTSAINFDIQYDRRDNRIMPTKGFYGQVTNEVSGSKLGGNNDFYRLDVLGQFYYPVYKSLIFKQYGRSGYVKSLNNDPVPLYERYFLGGVNSMRGYDWNTVGPRIRLPATPFSGEKDVTYGGDKQILFVTEFEYLVFPKGGVALVAFFDAGNAFAENQNISITNLKADYGFGLRWHSPMGPLRFEWGIPIIKGPSDKSVIFNFGMGSLF
ncbi:MAG: outer membrane protein assembly factor BamA [Pseudomonadota bacterium]